MMNPWGPLPGTGRRVGYRMGAFSSHKKDRTLPKINGLGDPVPSWRLGFIPDPGVRILPESLPDGRAGFTRTLAVPVRSRCAGASRSACLTVEPGSSSPWYCRCARDAPEPHGVACLTIETESPVPRYAPIGSQSAGCAACRRLER